MRISVTTLIITVALLPIQPAYSQDSAVRLAVIEVAPGSPVSEVFLDLLQIELEQTEALRLVDRKDVRQLLREQALALSLGADADPDQMLKLGRLVPADLFLLAEVAPLDDGNQDVDETALRLRLVESRYGLKLADDVRIIRAIRGSEQEAEAVVSSVAEWVRRHSRHTRRWRCMRTIISGPSSQSVSR
jgi:hypothetical protein